MNLQKHTSTMKRSLLTVRPRCLSIQNLISDNSVASEKILPKKVKYSIYEVYKQTVIRCRELVELRPTNGAKLWLGAMIFNQIKNENVGCLICISVLIRSARVDYMPQSTIDNIVQTVALCAINIRCSYL